MSNNDNLVENEQEETVSEPERYCMACSEPLKTAAMLICLDCLDTGCDTFEKVSIKK